MLTLFVLICMCSFIFNTELELKTLNTNLNQAGFTSSNNLLSQLTRPRFARSKNSTMKPGESVYSKNGKFILTIQASTCRLVLKNTSSEKVLYRSQELKKMSGCKAVLKRNSNFVVVTKKRAVVWSTQTAKSQKGKGPFRLTINSKGNVIVRNRKKECVWALFGCPYSKKFIGKISKLPPSKAEKIIRKRMEKLNKDVNGLPIKPLPSAKGKPEIKNQTPAHLGKKKPKPMKPVVLLSNGKINTIREMVNEGPVTGENWRNLQSILGKKVKKNQLKELKQVVASGNATYGDLRKKAMDKITNKLKEIRSQENRNPTKPKNKPKVETKKQLVKQINKQPWAKNIKASIKAGAPIRTIKAIVKQFANIKPNVGKGKSQWNAIVKAIKNKNTQKVIRLIALPIRTTPVYVRPVYYPPQKRWVLRYRSYITWRWSSYWSSSWRYHCWGWWWWRRCAWCNHWGGWVWYRYYYWTGYNYWSYE